MIIYKYRDISQRSIEILSKRELYFARPADLNDPLDSQVDIHGIYNSLRQFMGRLDGEVGLKLGFLVHVLNEHKFGPKDGNGSMLSLTQAMAEFVAAKGVCSLSKTHNDALLWSHYGSGHTGFCIGFDESRLKLDDVFIRKDVEYFSGPPHRQIFLDLASELADLIQPWNSQFKSDDQVTDNFYTSQISRMMCANLLVKSDSWRYEREYRLIRSKVGPAKFTPDAVREIVFGLKTTEDDRRAVLQTLTGPEWDHVVIRSVYQDNLSFDFLVLRESYCSPSEYLKAKDLVTVPKP